MAFLVCLLFRESIGVAITKSFVIFVRKFFVSSVLYRRRDYCLGCFFQLFSIIRNIWPRFFSFNMHVVVYTVSGHSHALDMAIPEHSILRDSTCSMLIGKDATSIVAALYPVDIPRGVCVL